MDIMMLIFDMFCSQDMEKMVLVFFGPSSLPEDPLGIKEHFGASKYSGGC